MTWTYKKSLDHFSKSRKSKLLNELRFGLEIEKLRIDSEGKISQKDFPSFFGAALTHPYISTDFSEAQFELVTPAFKSQKRTITFLEDLFVHIEKNLRDELLWPFSMPAILPKDNEIPMGKYGTSNQGVKKEIYRKGLEQRYGRKMQTVSGIHYNFSFSEKFWNELRKEFSPKQDLQDFINESFLKLQRNFFRFQWLYTYLFGSTPVIHKSYLNSRAKKLKKLNRDTYYGENATSLRTSNIGYYSDIQSKFNVSFNSLEEFINDLKYLISTPHKRYQKIGTEKKGERIQLNSNILQLENEFYAPIRAKRIPEKGESPLEALKKKGIQYMEVRAVDIDPLSHVGVCEDHLNFLQIFTTFCLLNESPNIDAKRMEEIRKNQNLVATEGRKRKLKLHNNSKKITIEEWGCETLSKMKEIAKLLDKNYADNRFQKTLDNQVEKLKNPDLTPSARILEMIKKEGSFINFGLNLAKEHKTYFKKQNLSQNKKERFLKLAEESIQAQKKLEFETEYYLEGYEDLEVSTQILLKEALKRGVSFDVIDRTESFVRLKKGKKIEYVKQATKTSLDSYMTFLIMENKEVTKKILAENNINVPKGDIYYDFETAMNDYEKYKDIPLVIKPNTTNFGIGVFFIKKGDKNDFKTSLEQAFQYGKSILVEEFISGKEFRFLVVGGEVIAILHRVPAHVVGDGKSKIRELVEEKNKSKILYPIKMGKMEENNLKLKKYDWNSIPKNGEQVFLRSNSNVSTGGDSIDFTDQIDKKFSKIAVEACDAVEAEICGLDMILEDYKDSNSKYAIIELNFNPALEMHVFPREGKKREVAGPVLDALGFK